MTGTPSAASASSKENEQPRTNVVRSSRQTSRRSVTRRPVRDGLGAEHAVRRQVRADVEVGAERGQVRVAGIGDPDQGAGLGVPVAVEQEVVGEGLRHDREVALQAAGGAADGVTGVGA